MLKICYTKSAIFYRLCSLKIIVEVGGHTNLKCQDDYCDQLSTMRARSVAQYLKSKGIAHSTT